MIVRPKKERDGEHSESETDDLDDMTSSVKKRKRCHTKIIPKGGASEGTMDYFLGLKAPTSKDPKSTKVSRTSAT